MNETSNIRAILAYNIKRLRESKKLTQQNLADLCDRTLLSICKIEGEKNWPKDDTVEKIASALGVSPSELFVDKRIEYELDDKIEIMKSTLQEFQNTLLNIQKNQSSK